MAGWDYILGETGYDQPFGFIDKGTNEGFDGTGVLSVDMTIINSDLSDTAPAINAISCVIDQANPLKIHLAVDSTAPNVPQTEGSYIVQFRTARSGELRKTYELGLRVFNG
jgi:hypothetical protein